MNLYNFIINSHDSMQVSIHDQMTSSYMVSFCCKMSHVSFLKISTLSIKYSLRYQTKCNGGCKTDSMSKNIWP